MPQRTVWQEPGGLLLRKRGETQAEGTVGKGNRGHRDVNPLTGSGDRGLQAVRHAEGSVSRRAGRP